MSISWLSYSFRYIPWLNVVPVLRCVLHIKLIMSLPITHLTSNITSVRVAAS